MIRLAPARVRFDVPVDTHECTLRRLAIGDPNVAGAELDPKTHALVRLGALIAVDAAPPSYLDVIEPARRAGATDEELVGCLVAVLPTVRNLLLVKDLMERHRLARPHVPFQFISAINRLPSGATEHLPRKKDGSLNAYVLGLAAQNAHRFETEQLIAGMQACLEANLKLVTTQLEHELILTELVVKLLGTSE